MPQITIITPVYKVEQYLDRCVESILAQTFTDFELILVDDGSPDKSGEMCDTWATKDSRIKVLHQENQGQAVARNNALDIANGEYIAFVDSDDYIHPRFLESLYINLVKSDAQVSICLYNRTAKDSDFAQVSNATCEFCGREYVKKSLMTEIDFDVWLLWNKLFKKECWENIRMPVGRINEDNATVYKILYDCERVVATDAVLYCYYENENSTVLQKFRKKHLDWLLVPKEMIEYFAEKGDALLLDKANKMYLSALVDMLGKVRLYLNDKAIEAELRAELLKQYKTEKKRYPITTKTHPALYNALYPKLMRIYWSIKGILNKFKRG